MSPPEGVGLLAAALGAAIGAALAIAAVGCGLGLLHTLYS